MATAAPALIQLRPRDRVALVVDELPAQPATVAATTKTAATLILDGRSPVPARVLHKRRAVLERFHDGRRFAGEGHVAMAAGRRGHAIDDALVFHFASVQRRTESRTPAVLPVTLVPLSGPVGPARALTLDISPGGALVRSPTQLERGERVQLQLQLPSLELPVPADGAVVRRTESGLLGVRVDRMRMADRELVLRWMRDQARAADR